MTTDAVCVILEKAWELKTHALIFVKDMSRFDIHIVTHDWKIHDSLNVLCIYSKKTEMETYIDCDNIFEIIIDVTGGDKEKEE